MKLLRLAVLLGLSANIGYAQQINANTQLKNVPTTGGGQALGYSGSAFTVVSSGGATLPSSGIVYALTTTTSRPATSADVVNLWTSCGSNFLKGDGTCSAGGGGTNPTVNGIQKWNTLSLAWTQAVVGTDYYGPDPTKNSAISGQAGSGGDASCPAAAASTDIFCYFTASNSWQRSINGGAYTQIPSFDPTTGVLSSPTGTGPDYLGLAESGSAPTGVVNVGKWWSSTDHKPHYISNAGSDTVIPQAGGDINTSSQIVATHLASPLPVAQGGTGTTVSFPAVQIVMPTSLLTANTCTTVATVTVSGLDTTKFPTFDATPATDPSAVTGWGATSGLNFVVWPTTNTLNWKECNVSAASITPGALTLNVKPRQNP